MSVKHGGHRLFVGRKRAQLLAQERNGAIWVSQLSFGFGSLLTIAS